MTFFVEHCYTKDLCTCVQVKAVKLGHILVIDEADKAPTNVTCILKTLVESGEMILADGRRIISGRLTHSLMVTCKILNKAGL